MIEHTVTLEKQGTLRPNDLKKHISTFSVNNLDQKSNSEDSFNQSEDDDIDDGEGS